MQADEEIKIALSVRCTVMPCTGRHAQWRWRCYGEHIHVCMFDVTDAAPRKPMAVHSACSGSLLLMPSRGERPTYQILLFLEIYFLLWLLDHVHQAIPGRAKSLCHLSTPTLDCRYTTHQISDICSIDQQRPCDAKSFLCVKEALLKSRSLIQMSSVITVPRLGHT
ncbi:hypothetical protein LZ32DRAFT_452960 [Colletotrichum eremochloae]|nr:hypothetical protein LZ32DRAFT_452960 [Colletotrichum eremochloae]